MVHETKGPKLKSESRVTPKSGIFEMSVRVVLSGVMTPRRLDLDNKAELPYNLLLQEVSFNLFWKAN